jgi:hypothetical protein
MSEDNPTPSWREIMESLRLSVDGIAASWNRRLRDFARSGFMDVVRDTVEAIQTEWGTAFLAVVERIRENYEWLIPPNWRKLDGDQLMRVARMMREEGLALAWVPSHATLERLLAADGLDARKAVLVEQEGRVLADLDRALDGVDRESVDDLLVATREAIELYRSGYYGGAQALATAGLTSAINNQLGRTLRKARQDFHVEDPEEEGMVEWRVSVVLGAVWKSLDEFWPEKGDPVPEHYNRHASTHRVGLPQYTQENALCAVMLLACTVIEIDWIARAIENFDEGEQEAA